MNSESIDPAYLTHQPFLAHYITKTSGDILELGTGFGSTPMLLKLIEGTGRKLISVDHNQEWINKMKTVCPPSENHQYIFTSNWCGTINELAKRKWSVVFIDQNPWEARAISLYAFKDLAEYTIVHDVDYFPKHCVFGDYISDFEFDFSKEFKKWQVYYPPKPFPYFTGPPTLVGSNLDTSVVDEGDIIVKVQDQVVETEQVQAVEPEPVPVQAVEPEPVQNQAVASYSIDLSEFM